MALERHQALLGICCKKCLTAKAGASASVTMRILSYHRVSHEAPKASAMIEGAFLTLILSLILSISL